MNRVKIHDKYFDIYITKEAIEERIKVLGAGLSARFRDKKVVAIGVLNGAFIFMADLIRHCNFDLDVRFIKAKSYEGMHSTGKVEIDQPGHLDLTDEHVILVEDIIDTGLTMQYVVQKILASNPSSLTVITLLQKPAALKHKVQIDEVGFSIPPAFVVGYGLDYDDLGRNLPGIYQLSSNQNPEQ